MKYFLTGATGFLGNVIAQKLREQNQEVIALVRNPEKAKNLIAIGVTIVKGDVTDKESMRLAMKNCDGVFHVAAWYKLGLKDSTPAYQINVLGTKNVLELMQEMQITKGVYTSTIAINSNTNGKEKDETFHFEGKHLSAYDQTKAAAHDVALQFIKKGLPLVIVMPGLIYGPNGTSLSDEALRLFLKKKLPLISKKTAYSWGHVDDIADAHILAMEKAEVGSTYMICGPTHTLEDAFAIASKITGIKKPLAVPPWLLKMTAAMVWPIEKIFQVPELYASETLRVSAGNTYLGNNHKAKKDLGFNPRKLEIGLNETLDYEMKKMNKK